MPSPSSNPDKLLVVEGPDDEHVIRHLCQRAGYHVEFDVEAKGNVEEVVQSIRVEAQVSGRVSLGVVVDANDKLTTRWQDISNKFHSVGVQLPPKPKADGTVEQSPNGLLRVGVWLMPDNSSGGELEDFLSGIVPSGDPIWPLAQTYVDDAFNQLPRQERPKRSKAEIHSWLASKNGGLPMGRSIGMGLFDPSDPTAQTFLAWLQRVFN